VRNGSSPRGLPADRHTAPDDRAAPTADVCVLELAVTGRRFDASNWYQRKHAGLFRPIN